jgi:uncharacterized protein YcbX
VAVVAALHLVPVKGLRVVAVDEVDLRPAGPAGDRAFLLRGPDGAIAMTTRNAKLMQIVPAWDPLAGELELAFPDGTRVAAPVVRGEPLTTALYDGRPVAGHLVDGPFAAAISAHIGRDVDLVAREDGETGADDHPVTLMSRASLAALDAALDRGGALDGRRFRMTVTIDGVEPWDEHGWAGREVRAGDAVLRVAAPVPRCVVTTREPSTGRGDAPVLKALAGLRGPRDVTFGVWCDVVAPGAVRVGDPIVVDTPGR